jgi:hypothetical protein
MKRLAAVFVAIVSASAACEDRTRTTNPPPPPPTSLPPGNPPFPTITRNPPALFDAATTPPALPPRGVPAPEANPKFRKASYAIGDTVAAKWNGTSWWIATVKAKNGDRYEVLYGDDTTGTVTAAEMLPIAAAPRLEAGDHVLACWKGPQMYTGVVTKKLDDGFEVKWDDGDSPLRVPAGKLTPF